MPQEIDFGTVSRLSPIVLEPSNLPDHQHFTVDFYCIGKTNHLRLVTTNRLIAIKDLKSLPDGPAMMDVQSVCQDGERSPTALYRIFIRSKRPAPPKAARVQLNEEETAAVDLDDLQFIRRRAFARTNPPAPAGAIITITPVPPPIPNSTNRSYNNLLRRNE